MTRARNLKCASPSNSAIVKTPPNIQLNELVYAKLKFYCPWPARVSVLFGRWCDVVFFGVPERWAKTNLFSCLLFINCFSITCVFISSQMRGINIPLGCVTRMRDGSEIKTKYWKRRGFEKAYDEMRGAATFVATGSRIKSSIETDMLPKITMSESNKTKRKQKPIKESIRRSPRLKKQKPEFTHVGLRRSARIEQKREFKSWLCFIFKLVVETFLHRSVIEQSKVQSSQSNSLWYFVISYVVIFARM